MATSTSTKLISLLMLTAAITACGGGGGGSDEPGAGTPPPPAPGTPTPPPPPPPPPGSPPPPPPPPPPPGSPPPPPPPGVPPAPTEAATGLSLPTLSLTNSTNPTTLISSFVSLARQMSQAYAAADEAAAALAAAQFNPGLGGNGTSPFGCPGGGQIRFTAGALPLDYRYIDCESSGYVFNGPIGSGELLNNAAGYAVRFTGLTVTGTDAPDGTLTGTSVCDTSGDCVTTLGGYRWGYDIEFAAGRASGTHQCTCGDGRTWNVVFSDFGATAGTAYVYATNGVATATRLSATRYRVEQTVDGVAFDAVEFDVP